MPQLRSYAELLTGCKNTGDQLVIAVIRDLYEKGNPGQSKSKNELFESLSVHWNGLVGEQLRNTRIRFGNTDCIDEERSNYIQLRRQVFLLTMLEGFTHEEIANILHISVEEVDHIQLNLHSEITRLVAKNTLIIEDNHDIIAELKKILPELGHSILNVTSTRSGTKAAINNTNPDLILADTRLVGGSCSLIPDYELRGASSVPIVYISPRPDNNPNVDIRSSNFVINTPLTTKIVSKIISRALYLHQEPSSSHATATPA